MEKVGDECVTLYYPAPSCIDLSRKKKDYIIEYSIHKFFSLFYRVRVSSVMPLTVPWCEIKVTRTLRMRDLASTSPSALAPALGTQKRIIPGAPLSSARQD